jgi:hypothetical protein
MNSGFAPSRVAASGQEQRTAHVLLGVGQRFPMLAEDHSSGGEDDRLVAPPAQRLDDSRGQRRAHEEGSA